MTDPEDSDGRAEPSGHRLPPIVWVLSAIAICVAIGFGIVAPALPIFATQFGVGATAAALVISIFAAVRMPSAFGVGKLVDRLGGRPVLATGLIVVAISSALAGLSQTYAQLLVLRGIGGVGSAMFSVSAASVMANRIPSEVRGRAMSIWSGSFLLGGVLGPVIGGPLTAISLRAPFFFYAATLAVGTVVALIALPRSPSPRRNAAAAGPITHDDVPSGATDTTPTEGIREALRLPEFRVALLGSFSQRWATSGRNLMIPLFVTQALMLSEAWGGYALAIAAAVNAVLLLPLGRWTDSHGRLGVVFVGGLTGAIGMAALAAPPAMWLMVLGMAVLGMGSAAQAVGPSAILGDVAQGRRGSVIATYQASGDAGTIFGPVVAGALIDLFGFSAGFGVAAAVCLAAGLVALPYIRSENRPGALSDPDGTMTP